MGATSGNGRNAPRRESLTTATRNNDCMKNTYDNRPLHPGWLIILALLGGGIASGLCAGIILKRCGKPKEGLIVAAAASIAGCALLVFCILWEIEWYWTSLVMQAVHGAIGIVLFIVIKKPYQQTCAALPPRRPPAKGISHEFAGAGAGLLTMLFFAPLCISLFILIIDHLFSDFIPIAADNIESLGLLFSYCSTCMMAGTVGGWLWVRFRASTETRDALAAAIAFLWAFCTLLFGLEITMALPAFQAAPASGNGYMKILGPIITIQFLFASWWSLLLCFYITVPPRTLGKAYRACQVLVLHLLIAVVFSISLGYPADLFLFLGKQFERHAHIGPALDCYEKGLSKQPNEQTSSWLQFEVALLSYKQGSIAEAEDGFRRVVAKYNANEELTKKAGYFIERLKMVPRKPHGARVVLPGIETRTSYQGSYCVPNSLALVMRYWGIKTDAGKIGRAITGLSRGTYAIDQAWYAIDKGLYHDFLPCATLDDIKRCIDSGFPVMVYVPMHVFVIFGYDDVLSTFVTYDVATHDIWVDYIQRDFIKSWKRQASTLMLVYPREKRASLPEPVRKRLDESGDSYLHFQAFFFDTLSSHTVVSHLKKAGGNKGTFFFPVAMLYNDCPGLRDSLLNWYDSKVVAQSIYDFFAHDYDEGAHLWGQINDQRWTLPDWALNYGITYLVGNGQAGLAENLIDRIDDEGPVSDEMVATEGMIDLSKGRFVNGIDRIKQTQEKDFAFYQGLANMKIRNPSEAVSNFADRLQNWRWEGQWNDYYEDAQRIAGESYYQNTSYVMQLAFDRFGYPSLALASKLLQKFPALGESRENIVSEWEDFIHLAPFDSSTAGALSAEYRAHCKLLDKEHDVYKYERLLEKQTLMDERRKRYSISAFSR
jgi:hypothetical protein